jgi:WXG100 family type VII secretion target
MATTPTFGNSNAATQAGIQAFHEAITNAGKIDTEIESQAQVLSRSWTGDAAKAYQIAVTVWRDGYNGVVKQLNYMVEALQGTVENINKVEAANTEQITDMLKKLHPATP